MNLYKVVFIFELYSRINFFLLMECEVEFYRNIFLWDDKFEFSKEVELVIVGDI